MAVQLLLVLSAVYLHTEDRHLGGNNDVTVQINSRDFSVGDTTDYCSTSDRKLGGARERG